MGYRKKRNFLIALIKDKRDFQLAHEQNWYRIPVKTKLVPKCVIDKTIKQIAFYQAKSFKDDPCCIRWYGQVKNVSVVKRKELLPDIANDPKAEDKYYKIEFDKLHKRREPIISQRPRRILFIPTTLWHFQHAKEINEVFYESPLEERFWEIMRDEQIYAERQFIETTDKGTFYLDFALFCKERNIDIECDGDTFHLDAKDVKRDKKRNNILESLGWSVLRYTTEEIKQNSAEVMTQVKRTINRNGGLQIAKTQTAYRYVDEGSSQLRLFDI